MHACRIDPPRVESSLESCIVTRPFGWKRFEYQIKIEFPPLSVSWAVKIFIERMKSRFGIWMLFAECLQVGLKVWK